MTVSRLLLFLIIFFPGLSSYAGRGMRPFPTQDEMHQQKAQFAKEKQKHLLKLRRQNEEIQKELKNKKTGIIIHAKKSSRKYRQEQSVQRAIEEKEKLNRQQNNETSEERLDKIIFKFLTVIGLISILAVCLIRFKKNVNKESNV